jgi:signal transduction histidine kinase
MRRRLRLTTIGGRIVVVSIANAAINAIIIYLFVVTIGGGGSLSSIKAEILVGGLVAIMMSAVGSAYYARMAANSIRRLQDAARKVADGNFETQIPLASVGQYRQLARTFNEMQRRLAELDSARKQFIANASHELRTPVTAIRAAAETLLDGNLQLTPDAREFVQMIARHADRLSRLTEDLLDLSKLETGAWKPQIGPVQLAPLAETVLDLFRERAAEKGIALQADVPERLRANADRRALEQVLVNLLDNAVKFTPKEGRVTLLGDGLGPTVMLSVVDSGPGIDPQHQARIFERFYRADAGRSRELGGTGLGLAIVKHLSQAMGGEAGLESTRNGSRFWVRLPSG